jgi:hypothetical protein
MEQNIDQILAGLGQTLKTLEQKNTAVDYTAVIENIAEIVKNIPYRSLSGDHITGGTIQNFKSIGIEDTARTTRLKVTENGIEAEAAKINQILGSTRIQDTLVAGSVTVVNDLTVSGTLRAKIDVNYDDILTRIPKRSLSGDLISGGTIRNFTSTGIKDTASTQVIAVKDDGLFVDTITVSKLAGDVTVERKLTASDLTVNGTLTAHRIEVSELKADIRLEKTTPLEFKSSADNPAYGKGLIWTGAGYTKQFILKQPDILFSTEHLEVAQGKTFMIDGVSILSAQELGPTVKKSRLTEVGYLKNLNVLGTVNVDDYFRFDTESRRFSLGTETPNASFSIVDQNVELMSGIDPAAKAFIGTFGYHDFNIVTDNTVRVSVQNNGHIVLGSKNSQPTTVTVHGKLAVNVNQPDPNVDLHVNGSIRFAGRVHNSGTQSPQVGFYNKGDITWNEDPRQGSSVGWVCVKAGTPGEWRPFGVIA